MKNENFHRKNTRLRNYNYSQNGTYFITICTENRRTILGKHVGATCGRPFDLTETGQIVDHEIKKIAGNYENVIIDNDVIMPNHIHLLISINSGENGRPQVAPTVSRIIQQFKGSITKQVGYPLWQKLFYDHIIRNEMEYQKIYQYIDLNPYQ